MAVIERDVDWHTVAATEALRRLGSRGDGLSEVEASERLARLGHNSLPVARRTSVARILVAQLRSVVVGLLAVAAVVAWLAGERLDAAAVFTVLLLNTLLGFATELKARRAMDALRSLDVPRGRVVRGGRLADIDASRLVPGDVIELEAGQAVSAEGRLLTAAELRCVEAALTGESVAVEKRADIVLPADTVLADRLNLVHSSTIVAAGSGRAVVVATGGDTEVGRIGRLVSEVREERTPLERRLDALGRRLVAGSLGVAAVVVVLGLLRGQPLALVLETALALAVAAVPEGLPAVATIALAVGVARMARRRVLVRRLPQVETLGSTTVVCTDKTGTLTAGVMTATTYSLDEREVLVSGAGYVPEGEFSEDGQHLDPLTHPLLLESLRIGVLCNRADVVREKDHWQAVGDPTEAALLLAARKAGLTREALLGDWPEKGEIPFSSERGWMATFHGRGASTVAVVKGAPRHVLDRTTRVATGSGEDRPLDAAARERIVESNAQLARRGLRVLALARQDGAVVGEPPTALTLIGLVGIEDPVADGVSETIAMFANAGIRTVMITGDQRLTAVAVAERLGILRAGGEAMEGRELSALSDVDLAARLPRVAAFSRVSPEDKLRIVTGLQAGGEIVTMLGDGVNDAPALRKADLGVAMGVRGTDVAKDAAAVVLQDDRFPTLAAAVEEGRVIFDNIRKFVFYLFSCNVAEILIFLVAGIAGLPQPLLPLQILWLNLVTDTFPALSLAVEPGGRGVMARPPRDPQEAVLSGPFLRSILFYASLMAAVTLAAFVWTLRGPSPESAVTIAFATIGLAQALHLGTARSDEAVLRRSLILANPWALAAVAGVIALQIVAITVTPLASILGLRPLSPGQWALAFGLAVIPAVVGQVSRARASRARELTP